LPNPERERIKILHQQLLDHQQQIRTLLNSKSWKITSPIRWTLSKFSKVFGSKNNSVEQIEHRYSPSSKPEITTTQDEAKHSSRKLARTALEFFLSSRSTLILPSSSQPKISILIVAYNQAELTFRCLQSLIESTPHDAEVIIVDNGSYDETQDLLNQIEGAHVIRNEENLHFIGGANQAANQARGEYILFLNNDTQLLLGSIQSALKSIGSTPDVGAVGAKLILPDGSLQEAGGIIWNDGSCIAYGRGDNPFASQYMFMRDVDYCSAAFLLTKRKTFFDLGGFDEAYKPAYYEDADYCLKLWENKMRVVYDPNAAVIHYEFGSSVIKENAIQLQIANRKIFVSHHAQKLSNQPDPKIANFLEARTHEQPIKKILFIDDRVPHPTIGSGFPRAHAILLSLRRLNCFVTCYPMFFINEDWSSAYSDLPQEVEIILGAGHLSLQKFLEERKDFYDAVIISRSPNMEIIQQLRQKREDLFQNMRVIYDSEALFSMRDAQLRLSKGEQISDDETQQLIQKEIALADGTDVVLSVSKSEQEVIAPNLTQPVHVLRHCVTIAPTSRNFSERSGLLFVGAIHDEESPNADAVRWFVKEIFPFIKNKSDIHFTIAGLDHTDSIAAITDDRIHIAGYVEDLTEIYDTARVFVAPSRFAAGIPLKILDAAAHGIPIIATSLLGQQLGWTNGEELLLADTAEDFAECCIKLYHNLELWQKLRDNALNRVMNDCSQESFDQTLRKILF
jgi:GT2 family glycosyltransferase